MKEVIVLGGGLAGLVAAICLRKAGIDVLLIEKKSYPFHRVCGEYISNEVKDFLKRIKIFPDALEPSSINQLLLSTVNGNKVFLPLPLGGFGISRFKFDQYLYEKAVEVGVKFMLGTQVSDVKAVEQHFVVKLAGHPDLESKVVIGAFGKRSRLDKSLDRDFLSKRSPFIGVKYHIKYDKQSANTIALHSFKDGYCGLVKIEDDKYNLCYLSARSNLTRCNSIQEMEQNILSRNPELSRIFSNAEFLFDKPKVINEISFETKGPIEQHVLMCGDAAGMITPLCGNGMAMAIHSAYILSEEVIAYFKDHQSKQILEKNYRNKWNKLFKNRLWAGRKIQKLFGAEFSSNMALNLIKKSKLAGKLLVKQTHGKPF